MIGVTNSLNQLFEKHRLVFWYDPSGEMREEFEDYTLKDLEKVEVGNNEFGLKHRMVRGQPESNFLLYLPFERPANPENWFLDLELAHHIFTADTTSLVLQEMGWQPEQRAFVEQYASFFKSKDRKDKLLEKQHADDDDRDRQLKMLAVLVREEATVEGILFALMAELAEGAEDKWLQIVKFGLVDFLWNEAGRAYNYHAGEPTLLDFAIEVFSTGSPVCAGADGLGREAGLFLRRWCDIARYSNAFEKLSGRLQEELNVGERLAELDDFTQLAGQDAFEQIEKKFIVGLRDGLLGDQVSLNALRDHIEERKGLYWYVKYQDLYEALAAAAEMFDAIAHLDFGFDNASQAIRNYGKKFYIVDQYYRQYCLHASRSNQATLMAKLSAKVENFYVNKYLLPLNDQFQSMLDKQGGWPPDGALHQRQFHSEFVMPHILKNRKLFVVVSDALRYEVAEELDRKIRQQDRFSSKLEPLVGVLPSYTQLGMASLLPHGKLTVDPSSGAVLADGMGTQGIDARKKVLQEKCNASTTAFLGKDFLNLSKDEGREITKEHDLVFIYHNGIDAAGDKTATQHKTFEAVEDEFEVLLAILRKISAINGNNVLITADHGFLFTSGELDPADFTTNPTGGQVGVVSRRFAIGTSFEGARNMMCFKSKDLGLDGDTEFAIPKSINRFRVKGSGSQYVHGGASLQEIVLPVLAVNKSRVSDVETVEVDVLRTGNTITTGQKSISFYQESAAGEKSRSRELRIGFYSSSDELLSDAKTINFDSKHEDARNRERKIVFTFTKAADSHHGGEIHLKLDEKIKGSNKYRNYKKLSFRFMKAFETDFE